MLRKFLGAKLHRMRVTEANLDYAGSITIDDDLLGLSGILPGEQVLVACVNTGARFETYVVRGEAGRGVICINGAAARPPHRVSWWLMRTISSPRCSECFIPLSWPRAGAPA